VFLDDGFSKYDIEKFDILIRPEIEPTNLFCLPSGGYREPKIMYSTANMVLQDGVDFQRVVAFKTNNKTLEKLPKNIVCLTAISKPNRLEKFLPQNTKIISFPDHHNFIKEEIDEFLKSYKDYSIITTAKDLVKLKKFNLTNLILMDLEIKINENVNFAKMEEYIYTSSH